MTPPETDNGCSEQYDWLSGDDLPRFRGWVVGIGAAVTLACIAVGGWLAIQQP
jgi:hypothetical protein